MPEVARDLVIHVDSKELTYHSSVKFPPFVPVCVDANDEAVIGRAVLRRIDDKVIIDLHLHEVFPGIPRPFTCLIGTNPETVLFDAEDGTNYLLYGAVEKIAVLSGTSPVIENVMELGERSEHHAD